MADNRKYYYLKLKENFFDSDSIVLLEDMKDGILYSNILLKLYLKSLKNGGKLQLDEHIPYTAQMIATLTRHQIGTVERALEIFRQLGLVEQLDSGAFYMTDIELMIGQSSTEAERKRAARLENKALLPPRTKGGHLSDIRPPEIELEKEIEIKREIGKLILQQLSVWFGLPIITAIIVAAVVIAYFIQTISAEISAYIGFSTLMLQIGATMGILAILLICYFISTWIIFRRSVNP